MIYKAVFFASIVFLSSLQAHAQTPLFSIRGIIADSLDRKPVSYVNVSVKNDSEVLKVAVSKEDGTFIISGLQPSSYTVTFTFIGYTTVSMPVRVTSDIDLKTIFLNASMGNLQEVSIVAKKLLIKQEADRISYDLQQDPDSKSSSALEMMRKIPYLSVDGNDNVLLKGSSGFQVFINGKPSGMFENNLKEVLRSMPASTIQRIEVITDPPSKYDAEGLAGIINIITTKKMSDGYIGSLTVNERFPAGGPGTGGTITFKDKKFGFSGFGGASATKTPVQKGINNRISNGTAPSLLQNFTNVSSGQNGYIGGELSYEVDSLNLVAVQLNFNNNASDANSDLTSKLTGNGSLPQAFSLDGTIEAIDRSFDAALNYQLGTKRNKRRLWTFSARYVEFGKKHGSLFEISERQNYTSPNYTQYNIGGASEQTYQIDYYYPLEKLTIEAGAKTIFRKNTSDFQYHSFDPVSGSYVLESNKTNSFTNLQNILAAYNSYKFKLNNWTIQGGLRVEHTRVIADFISTGSIANQSYYTLVPSLSGSLKGQGTLRFAISQRINRPGINALNPFIDRSVPGYETVGNPNLEPQRINTMSLGYSTSGKISVNVSLEANAVNGINLPVARFDPVSNITRVTRENAGKVRVLGPVYNFNYPLTPKLNLSLNGSILHFWISGIDKGQRVSNNVLRHTTSFSAGYQLGQGWRLGLSLSEESRNPTGFQGYSNAYVTSSSTISKELISNKLSLAATVHNPFSKYRNVAVRTTGPDFSQFNNNQIYFRAFNFSLNYKFGKLKDSIPKNQRQIKNDDIAN